MRQCVGKQAVAYARYVFVRITRNLQTFFSGPGAHGNDSEIWNQSLEATLRGSHQRWRSCFLPWEAGSLGRNTPNAATLPTLQSGGDCQQAGCGPIFQPSVTKNVFVPMLFVEILGLRPIVTFVTPTELLPSYQARGLLRPSSTISCLLSSDLRYLSS